MADISDLILLMGAMIIFSLLSSNAAKTFQTSSNRLIRAELEYRSLAAAQDIIDEVRWISDEAKLFNNSGTNSFFKNYPITRTITFGEDDQYTSELLIDGYSTSISTSTTVNKYLITVIAQDSYLRPPINDTLVFVKSFNQ